MNDFPSVDVMELALDRSCVRCGAVDRKGEHTKRTDGWVCSLCVAGPTCTAIIIGIGEGDVSFCCQLTPCPDHDEGQIRKMIENAF